MKTVCTYEYPLLANGVGTTHDEGSGVSLELPSYQVNSEVNHLTLGREGVGRITISEEEPQNYQLLL